MATQEERIKGVETHVGNIRERLGNIEGLLDGITRVRTDRSPNAALITLLSILGVAVITYWGWVGVEVVSQGKQISQILGTLSPEIIKEASSRPDDPQSAKQVEQAVKRAMSQGYRVDPNVIADAGLKFADAGTRTAAAWQAATDLLNYRSFLNTGPTPQPQLVPVEKMRNYKYQFHAPNQPIEMMGRGIGVRPNVAELHFIGQPDENAASLTGPLFLVIKGGSLILDSTYMKNIVIQGSHVSYRGGPLTMDNVYFVNCTFDIQQLPKGLEFAKAAFLIYPLTFTTG